MQMILDDLRKSNDPLAALLAMSDSDLDRVAAESIGAEVKNFPGGIGEDSIPHYSFRVRNADGIKGKVRREAVPCRDWQPSRDLNQAYELLDSGDRQNRYVWACDIDGDGRYVELISQRLGVVQVYFEQAGSHARAVCVLAILGLLQSRKDGGE